MSTSGVRRWLYVTSGFVGASVLLHGADRLKCGIRGGEQRFVPDLVPPMTSGRWQDEFAKYSRYPDYDQNPIHMRKFQLLYLAEWGHRYLSTLSAIVFFVPYTYFLSRRRLPSQYSPLLHLTLYGFGLQTLLGWDLVQSRFNFKFFDDQTTAAVSSYKHAVHLSLSVALYSSMMYCAFRLSPANIAAPKRLISKTLGALAILCLSTSIVSGAAVTALGAGKIYNDFPWMGDWVLPRMSELTYMTPTWRNIFENPSAAQAVHKLSSCGALASIVLLGIGLRKTHLTRFRLRLYALSCGQVGLGVAALMTKVDPNLGMAHQGTALALLTTLLYVMAAA
ncbi:cytochrome oxidase assembly protein [Perkinsela sp. CCAP 1560/4]|nr:cytochrome oxidase assembly protein [Perkinsela sp. CCAP 1560/4]|eukprot:KNH04149.1 cytochrome oxidase assembly protein [Perkinsela sp. CCAP 1560/4]